MILPDIFEKNMKELLKDDFPLYFSCLDKPMFHGIRINTGKISVEDFMKINPFNLTPIPWCMNGFYFDDKVDKPSKHPYYYAGLYYIQEPSAMTPASVLPINPGDRVLDICAAPGGKSTELAAKLDGSGILVSNDISASRAKALLKNIEVFGVCNSLIISEAPYRLSERFSEYFDKILIDAPCSGEGMFRKSISMVNAWDETRNDFFSDLQKQILNEAVKMLKPGGMLLYSTCTFSPKENEKSIDYLLSLDSRLKILDFPMADGFDSGHPEWSSSKNPDLKKAARIWPHKVNGEGHFVCLIKKSGEASGEYNRGSYPLKCKSLPDEAKNFLGLLSKKYNPERLEISNDKLYYIPESFPEVKGLRILRCGLFMGELKKNRFEPSQALAMSLSFNNFSNTVSLSSDDPRVIKYLKGETIEVKGKNGWCLICVDTYPLGWGKLNNGILKNKYLPGWRLI